MAFIPERSWWALIWQKTAWSERIGVGLVLCPSRPLGLFAGNGFRQRDLKWVDAIMSYKPEERVSNKPQRVAKPSAEEELRARLGELRRQREQAGPHAPPSGDFQRRGLPVPPAPQPPLKNLLKQWWEHGPFSGTPQPPPVSEEPAVARKDELPSLNDRAESWLNQSRQTIAGLNTRAQGIIQQARRHFQEVRQSQPLTPEEEVIPGLIMVSFAPTVSHEEGVKLITALGGKPLRYKAALNKYQVAVPPGQEQHLIERYRRHPGVIAADLERPPTQQ